MLAELRPLPYFHFVPMTNSWYFGKRELLGICIASRWPITANDVISTWGDGVVRDLEGVDTNNERIADKALSDALVLKTQNRVAIACSVMAPGVSGGLRVATHHGFWTRDGESTPEQMQSTARVTEFLAAQGRTHGGLLYMADYNPDKHGKMHAAYISAGGRDWLPAGVETTLAHDHPAAKLGIKSDCVMTWPDEAGKYGLRVIDVRLDDAPGSDHLLLCCKVDRSPDASLS